MPVDPQASSSLFHRIEQKVQPRLILLGDLVPGLEGPRHTPVWLLREVETTSDQSPVAPIDLDPDDVAEIVFTSGTTAEPKGVINDAPQSGGQSAAARRASSSLSKVLSSPGPLRIFGLTKVA